MRGALAGLPVLFIANPAFADGLATSLVAGVAAQPSDSDGALVLLGDMPEVTAALLDALIETFARSPGASAVVPTYRGQRGNPVLIGRRLFAAVENLTGDEGARRLLKDAADVVELSVDDPGVVGARERVGELAFALLPAPFTLAEGRRAFEAVLGGALDPAAFQAEIEREGLVREVDSAPSGEARYEAASPPIARRSSRLQPNATRVRALSARHRTTSRSRCTPRDCSSTSICGRATRRSATAPRRASAVPSPRPPRFSTRCSCI